MNKNRSHTGLVFQSRLARRIFFNFIACAMLPLIAMAVIAFYHASYEMGQQAKLLLNREIKSITNGLIERLMIQQTRMDLMAANISGTLRGDSKTRGNVAIGDFERWFRSAAIVDATGNTRTQFGRELLLPELSAAQQAHLEAGKMLITTPGDSSGIRILFTRRIATEASAPTYLWAEADSNLLWQNSFDKHLPYGAEACLFDAEGRTIYESFAVQVPLRRTVLAGVRQKDRGHFEMSIDGEAHYASYRLVLLQELFLVGNWAVVLVQQRYELTRTIDKFKRVFPLAIFVALGVVVLLSINLIRSSLVPLKNLIHGTRRIARKDFSNRIEVSSKDEFCDLAHSFNHMSSQLNRQFRAMTASAEVDRAILSNLEQDNIVASIIQGIHNIIHCDRIGIGILTTDGPVQLKIFQHSPEAADQAGIVARREAIDLGDIVPHLPEDAEVVPFEGAYGPGFLAPFKHPGIHYQAVVPVRIQKELTAFIVLGYGQYEAECQDHFEHARKMADQMAVALANERLLSALDQSHWGALHALASAVDAKSPWTAGHSERVAHTAQIIGEALGLDDAALDRLHRSGLLHDLGKIGVPAAILDKKDSLTEQEFTKIKSHPSIGARILEPIPAFKDVVPIILQHHERFDGQGYPLGLEGEAIDFCARILAVADAFDALLSKRPYREGVPFEKVIAIIQAGAEIQFDPRVVDALLASLARLEPKDGDKQQVPADGSGTQCVNNKSVAQKLPLKEAGV